MAPRSEKSQLKRGRGTAGEDTSDPKKPRRSERLSSQASGVPASKKQHLPSPVTHAESTPTGVYNKEATATPPEGRPSQLRHRSPELSLMQFDGGSSPPQDTQAFSQFAQPNPIHFKDIEDEIAEGVWGYLLPLDAKYGDSLVLQKRSPCPLPDKTKESSKKALKSSDSKKGGRSNESANVNGLTPGGYLIGRHPECDFTINDPIVSNRHCLIFTENKGGDTVAFIEDLSSNGTFVNEAIIGRNNRRELRDQDEITVLDKARFIFRYPRKKETSAFALQYTILEKLGRGHFAEVSLCVEKATGQRYAVKVFTREPGVEDRSKTEGLQQEIAVLMGVSHPNMLCVKDIFDEPNAVYLVLELASEGELFNWIVMNQKLTEDETRKVFIQLFEGVKYLHERNIVHRDIKPENILLTDKNLSIKLADFGLAKIIGEESFTTTLCGTPSYVAPEILEDTRNRKYSRAVDIWALGVVLYICLCGFPPFAEELFTRENPYNLTQQIRKGLFNYPSPYWDSVDDLALDLIDRMLTVDVEERLTIDECLNHPWTTQKIIHPNDSTDGLVGSIANLDFSARKVARERTLLSSINDAKTARRIEIKPNNDPVTVYIRDSYSEDKIHSTAVNNQVGGPAKDFRGGPRKEDTPSHNRNPQEFMGMGGKGDQSLFDSDQ